MSPRPGFTTSMQEVVLDRSVRLLDSPGVVFSDESALLGNCVDAESIDDPIPPVDALLKRCNPESLMMTYNIPAFRKDDTMMFLAMVAKSYGRVLKGGIPDKIGAARSVLKDWNQGKIPYYTVPPEDIEPNVEKGNAVVVSSFGAEFDLSKYDDQVLSSLKENDELDFIKIIPDGENNDKMEEDDDDDDDDDDGNNDMEDDTNSRLKLSKADDYDFNTM